MASKIVSIAIIVALVSTAAYPSQGRGIRHSIQDPAKRPSPGTGDIQKKGTATSPSPSQPPVTTPSQERVISTSQPPVITPSQGSVTYPNQPSVTPSRPPVTSQERVTPPSQSPVTPSQDRVTPPSKPPVVNPSQNHLEAIAAKAAEAYVRELLGQSDQCKGQVTMTDCLEHSLDA